ncbi:MAG: SurA N-terminal domain-containing protein [Elusimicrobiaceae bacterium]|nr:SurA N-terminal domain-containing protein [Elusimicrobiaceae bacterium]
MISLMNKYKKSVFVATTTIFLVATLVGLGGYLGGGNAETYVVTIGDDIKVDSQQYQQMVNSKLEYYRQQGLPTEALEPQIKRMIVNDLVTDAIFSQAAKDYGISVSDFEVSVVVRSQPAFFTDGKFNPQAYYRLIWDNYRVKPDVYEERIRQSRMAEKFKQLMAGGAMVMPDEAKAAYLAENKNLKDFEEKKAEFTAGLQREKATELINYYLKRYLASNKVVEYKDNM